MPITVANLLTASRLAAVPLFIYLLFAFEDDYRFLALLVYGLAALTDLLDGYVARRTGTVTQFGRIADPLADRILIISGVIALYIKAASRLPLWAVSALVSRDLVMIAGSGLMILSGKHLRIIMAGKASTALTLVALCVLMVDRIGSLELDKIGIALFYAGLAFALFTGLFYIALGTKILLSKQGSEKTTA